MAKFRITTPEHVHFHYETAGLLTRAMAWTVDQLLIVALKMGAAMGLGRFGVLGVALIFVAWFLIDFGYYTFTELRRAGQSPGKRLLHIRVMSANGANLQFADVLIRNLMRAVDTLPIAMLVGGVVAWIDPLNRRLGDLAAETLVVRDARRSLPQAMLRQRSRVNTFQDDVAVRNRILTRVTREERDLILDLMVRRDDLAPEVREDLFRQAAERFRARYSLPEDLEHLSDEQTVLNLALVIQGMKFSA